MCQPKKTHSHPGLWLQGGHQLALETDGSRENNCVRCDQVDYLLGLVAELREDIDRLRSISDSEQERD